MAHINIDGEQNVEVSKPIPSEKSPEEQLEIMEEYTRVHKESAGLDKALREINCLKVIFPRLFRSLEPGDLIAGRLDFLPIGFGSVTSIGGVGHYCVFHKLRAFKSLLHTEEQKPFKYRNYYDSYFLPLMERLGFDQTPHCCRHTFISLLAEAKVSPTYTKMIAGHKGAMTMTEKVYTHIDMQYLIDAVNSIYYPKHIKNEKTIKM